MDDRSRGEPVAWAAIRLRTLRSSLEAFEIGCTVLVFGHACRLADTRQDAEDVVASAFLELWRRRAEVRLVDGG